VSREAGGPARGHYGDAVRRYFSRPAHAGEPPAGRGPLTAAEAAEGGAGARIMLTAVTDGGRLIALRYRVFGCPHLIAAAEAVCERFEGRAVEELADFKVAELMASLEIPLEKTGRILLLEDAIRALRARLERHASGGRRDTGDNGDHAEVT
jgi:NifU-like protein involved in Fe-S cluster formation